MTMRTSIAVMASFELGDDFSTSGSVSSGSRKRLGVAAMLGPLGFMAGIVMPG